MPSIRFENTSFHYTSPFTQVFDDVTFAIDTHWRTALVGRNGRGKTTLLRLITGELEPVSGRVLVPDGMRYFPHACSGTERPTLEVIRDSVAPFTRWEREMERLLASGSDDDIAEYTRIREQYEEAGGYDVDARIERELTALGMSAAVLERPFQQLSEGERTRASIVALFMRPDTFPLIDEPTNHLDQRGRELLGEYLQRKPGFVLVSHDRYFLDLCADHVVSINRSDIRVNQCTFSRWQEEMEREEEHERRRRDNLQREASALEAAARKRRGWSDRKEKEKRGAFDKGHIGHRAAKQMKRALSIEERREEALSEKKELLKNVEKEGKLRMHVEKGSGDTVLELDGVTVDRGGRTILHDVSLSVGRGQRIALVGPNGCGKSTLLHAIAGELPLAAGNIRIPARLQVARAYQTPRWNSGLLGDHLRADEIDETHFRSALGSLDVRGDIFDRPLETFSQGERKKVDLCRSFLGKTDLFLWDEPMNYIDLASREAIEELLLETEPTLLVVEHDRRFVERIATGVFDLSAQ